MSLDSIYYQAVAHGEIHLGGSSLEKNLVANICIPFRMRVMLQNGSGKLRHRQSIESRTGLGLSISAGKLFLN